MNTQLGEQGSAILVSGKLFNDADDPIWPTEGRISTPAGLRYAFLMVGPDQGGMHALPADVEIRSNDPV